MKTTLFLLCAMVPTSALSGNASSITNAVPVTTNLIFSLDGKDGFPKSQFKSDELVNSLLVGTSTNYIKFLVFPFDQAFGFELYDDQGRELAKTERGLANSKSASPPTNMSELNKLASRVLWRDKGDFRALFRPDDMFVITNKGVYDLEVRIRLCVPMTNGVPDYEAMNLNKWFSNTRYGVIISDPVRVKVIKE
jgi:hypothetical protein